MLKYQQFSTLFNSSFLLYIYFIQKKPVFSSLFSCFCKLFIACTFDSCSFGLIVYNALFLSLWCFSSGNQQKPPFFGQFWSIFRQKHIRLLQPSTFFFCYLSDGSGSLSYPSREPGRPRNPGWPPAAGIYLVDPTAFSYSSRELACPHDPGWPPAADICQMNPVEILILLRDQTGTQSWLFSCCNLLDGSGNLSYPSRKPSWSAILVCLLQLPSAGGDLAAFQILPGSQTVYMILAGLLQLVSARWIW